MMKLCIPLALALGGSMAVPWAGGAQSGTIAGRITVPKAGITGVVVYLVPIAANGTPPAGPVAAEINQFHLRFDPGIIAVTPGSTVAFPNSDPVLHNVFHPSLRGSFDLGTYPQGERRSFTFKEEGAFVIFCHVHPEMVAYVVVVNSPYRTVTDDTGQFRLDGIAPGSYRLITWHRRLRTQDQLVAVPAGGTVRVDLALVLGSPGKPQAHETPGQ